MYHFTGPSSFPQTEKPELSLFTLADSALYALKLGNKVGNKGWYYFSTCAPFCFRTSAIQKTENSVPEFLIASRKNRFKRFVRRFCTGFVILVHTPIAGCNPKEFIATPRQRLILIRTPISECNRKACDMHTHWHIRISAAYILQIIRANAMAVSCVSYVHTVQYIFSSGGPPFCIHSISHCCILPFSSGGKP